jgi:abortive infection bacteriophage resistance protein
MSNYFSNAGFHQEFLNEIKEEIRRNSKAPFVRNFRQNYVDGKMPFYALIELFSFGTLFKFLRNMFRWQRKPWEVQVRQWLI